MMRAILVIVLLLSGVAWGTATPTATPTVTPSSTRHVFRIITFTPTVTPTPTITATPRPIPDWDSCDALTSATPLTQENVKDSYALMACHVNAAQAEILARQRQERICVDVHLAAGHRYTYTLKAKEMFRGNEIVRMTVMDGASPGSLVSEGVGKPSGTSVSASVWNQDADHTHSGKLCAVITRQE